MNTLIRDTVTGFSLQGYVGNTLTVLLTLLGDFVVPPVTAKTFQSADGKVLPDYLQPQVSVSGRVITISYPASSITVSYWTQVYFAGRAVLAGKLEFSRGTVAGATLEPYQLSIKLEPGTAPIGLQLAVVPGLGESLSAASRAESAADLATTARDVAQEAAQVATDAVGNVLTLVEYDDSTVTMGIGGSVQVTENTDRYSSVTLDFL